MKKVVKPLVFTLLLIASTLNSFAQIRINTPGGFVSDMKKVIRDYPNQFSSIRDSVIEQNPQSTSYQCNLKVTGSESCHITSYSSKTNSSYSWEAIMLTTEDFETATKRFKALHSQFNNLAVKMDYGVTFYLKGKYAQPDESKGFTSVMMQFEKADQIVSKMRVELSLRYELMEWKVRVLIYERDREDDERGEIYEEG